MHLRDNVSTEHRKPYAIYRIVPLSMTLGDLWPGFQGHDIFWRRISEKLKSKLLLHNSKVPHIRNDYVWWPWLKSKRVARVCHHQLSFLLSRVSMPVHACQVRYCFYQFSLSVCLSVWLSNAGILWVNKWSYGRSDWKCGSGKCDR